MRLEQMLHQHGVDLDSLSLPEYQRAGKESPISLLHIPTMQALSQWALLRQLVPETGYWPVISWDTFKKPPWEEEPVQDIVEEGLHVDLHHWFEKQWSELRGERMMLKQDRGGDAPFAFRHHLRRRSQSVPIALLPLKRKAIKVGWKATFQVLEALASLYGDEHVRLVVWFED